MGDRRCCCGCRIAYDDFERPDSNDLGDNWPLTHGGDTWQTGDWDIESGKAVQQDSEGVAIHKTRHKLPDESMVVEATVYGHADLPEDCYSRYRVLLNVKDAENFHCVDYVVRNNPWVGNEDEIVLGKVSGGVYSELTRDIVEGPASNFKLWGRIGGGIFCGGAYQTVFSYVAVNEDVISGGYWAGIGVIDGVQPMMFDDFEFLEHFETNHDCPFCGCRCEENVLPPTLWAVLNGDPGGRMSGLVDCEVELTWNRKELQWEGSAVCCKETFNLKLHCGDPPAYLVDSFRLSIQGCTDSDPGNVGGWVDLYPNEGSTCDPLNLEFGPISVSSSDLACVCGNPFEDPGSYMIVITE